jgi:hypothetical protein
VQREKTAWWKKAIAPFPNLTTCCALQEYWSTDGRTPAIQGIALLNGMSCKTCGKLAPHNATPCHGNSHLEPVKIQKWSAQPRAPWIAVTEFDCKKDADGDTDDFRAEMFRLFHAMAESDAESEAESQENAEFYDEMGWSRVLEEVQEDKFDLFSLNLKSDLPRIVEKIRTLT